MNLALRLQVLVVEFLDVLVADSRLRFLFEQGLDQHLLAREGELLREYRRLIDLLRFRRARKQIDVDEIGEQRVAPLVALHRRQAPADIGLGHREIALVDFHPIDARKHGITGLLGEAQVVGSRQ